MIRLAMKKDNTILTETVQKYQHYYQVKLINMTNKSYGQRNITI